jgi:hypothetical protein
MAAAVVTGMPKGRRREKSMSQSAKLTSEHDQIDGDAFYEVADKAKAATFIEGQYLVTIGPTIMVGGWC